MRREGAKRLVHATAELALCGYDVGGKASVQLSHYPGTNNARYGAHDPAPSPMPAHSLCPPTRMPSCRHAP